MSNLRLHLPPYLGQSKVQKIDLAANEDSRLAWIGHGPAVKFSAAVVVVDDVVIKSAAGADAEVSSVDIEGSCMTANLGRRRRRGMRWDENLIHIRL